VIILIILATLLPFVTFAQTEIEGEVSGEWTAEDSPYIVIDSTWIPEDEELIIGPGVDVLFGEGLGLDVFGTLNAEGTEDDSVRFLSREENEGWSGIRLYTARTEHSFTYCLLLNVDGRLIRLGSSMSLLINHCNIACEGIILSSVRGQQALSNSFSIANSNLSSPNNGINFSWSRLVSTDSNFNIGSISFDSIRLERCSVIGSIDTFNSVYIDCEFIPGEGRSVYLYGNDALMENCTVDGTLRIDLSENLQILNSIITGTVWGNDFTGSIIGSEFHGRSFRFYDCSVDFNKCTFTGILNLRSQNINMDSCRINGEMRISGDEDEEEMITINRCLIIGHISRVSNIDNFYFNNNTVLYDYRDTYTPLFNFVHDHFNECQITNNLIIAVDDSCQLFRFINYDATFPDVSFNCIWGVDYILHSYNRSNDTPFVLNETNIMSNPRVISIENRDFNLDWNSPCIDAGDPDSPRDPDRTRADIGAYYRDRNLFVSRYVDSNYNSTESLILFPNPFNSYLNIHFIEPLLEFYSIKLYDITGRYISSIEEGLGSGKDRTLFYYPSGLPTGSYYIGFSTTNTTSFYKIELIK